jgi:hypothetical protein
MGYTIELIQLEIAVQGHRGLDGTGSKRNGIAQLLHSTIPDSYLVKFQRRSFDILSITNDIQRLSVS